MRMGFVAVVLLMVGSMTALAQYPYGYGFPLQTNTDSDFSIELGTGLMPLHMILVSVEERNGRTLAEQGLRPVTENASYPVITLSEVWRISSRMEICLTEGASWMVCDLFKYEQFGYDPAGNPRYDLLKHSPAGRVSSRAALSLTARMRFIWSPRWRVTVYSDVGLGFTSVIGFVPIPEITPMGLRYGNHRIYGFVESTLGPYASLIHGGLGCKI